MITDMHAGTSSQLHSACFFTGFSVTWKGLLRPRERDGVESKSCCFIPALASVPALALWSGLPTCPYIFRCPHLHSVELGAVTASSTHRQAWKLVCQVNQKPERFCNKICLQVPKKHLNACSLVWSNFQYCTVMELVDTSSRQTVLGENALQFHENK